MSDLVDKKEGFWYRHLRFVKENDPENLPEILHAYLMTTNPLMADLFKSLWYKGRSFTEDMQISRDFMAEHNIVL